MIDELMRDDPEQVQGVGMVRVDRQGLAIRSTGLFQLAPSVMLQTRRDNVGGRSARHGSLLWGIGGKGAPSGRKLTAEP